MQSDIPTLYMKGLRVPLIEVVKSTSFKVGEGAEGWGSGGRRAEGVSMPPKGTGSERN